MSVRTFAFNKLVRDKMYNSIKDKGVEIELLAINNKADLIECFKKKLLEEVHEVNDAQNEGELLEELVDCMDVISGFIKNLSISQSEFEAVRKAKNDDRGGFEIPMETGGSCVAANITQDVETGIGSWSKEKFIERFKY